LTQASFSEITDYVYQWEASKPLSFPLFFGLDSAFLSDGDMNYSVQSLVRYGLMHYFLGQKDRAALQTWMDTNVLQLYSVEAVRKVGQLLFSSVIHCEEYPNVCFLLYGFTDISLGFLSDRLVMQKLFPMRNLSLQHFPLPFASVEQPMRLWGWVVPQ